MLYFQGIRIAEDVIKIAGFYNESGGIDDYPGECLIIEARQMPLGVITGRVIPISDPSPYGTEFYLMKGDMLCQIQEEQEDVVM